MSRRTVSAVPNEKTQGPCLEAIMGEDGLLTHLPVGLLLLGAGGALESANSMARELLDLGSSFPAGSTWLTSFGAEDRRAILADLAPSSAGSHPPAREVWLEGGGQRLLWRAVPAPPGSTAPGKDPAGDDDSRRPVQILAVLVELPEGQLPPDALRRTAQELEERVRELNCLFEISRAVERSAGDLPAILEETVSILPGSLRFPAWGCARITLDGADYMTPGYSDPLWSMDADISIQGETAGMVQVGYREGVSFHGEGPFLPEERTLLEAVAQRLGRTAERVKGRRLLQEREEEMRQRLTHLTRVSTMGEMASSIAHEVNQPLTAVATYALACRRMLENGEATEEDVREVLTRISEEAMRAGGIIHRLKDMVRRQESRWAEFDVNALIRDVEELASVDARLHDVRLTFQLAPRLPPVLADGIQVQQVVLNLVRNAIDAVQEADPPLRQVVLRTELEDRRWIRVSVEDNGCGLPPDADESMFQPFFTTKKSGMGMGLSISRSIVLAHHGRIAFEPGPGPGALFYFTLPVLDEV